jgi:hypothetical protein
MLHKGARSRRRKTVDINIGAVLGGVVFLTLFLLPSYLAFHRGVHDKWLVLIVNVFLGGTVIGWGVALYLALRKPRTVVID